MQTHTSIQDFYPILYCDPINEATNIILIQNVVQFWKQYKDLWFSHSPMSAFPTVTTLYKNEHTINLSLLLQYDQILRHPHPYITISDTTRNLSYKFASAMALKMIHSSDFSSKATWEKVFVLLAIRHNSNITLKRFVLKKVYDELNEDPTNSLLLRFLRATIWDIHTFEQATNGYASHTPSYAFKNTMNISSFNHIVVPPQINPQYDSHASFGIFLDAFNDALKYVFSPPHVKSHPTIAVSISGGVDSMVASYIMKQICDINKQNLILLHICYGNRDCCDDEIKMLTWWAHKLQVPLYIQTIDDIRRGRNSNFRELYEDITRKIRFSFYRYFNCPVILGHNLDDCHENMFSNLSKSIHFNNLFGMSTVGKEVGVVIIRPMLHIAKTQIINFADHNNIPHLQDSTPKWSRRGKTRDTLIPSIMDFDKHIIRGLHRYVQYTSMLADQWKTSLNKWISESLQQQHSIDNKHSLGIIMPRDSFFEYNYTNCEFWNQLWFQSNLRKRPSNKSILNLIRIIQRKCDATVVLNSSYRALIRTDTITIEQYSSMKNI